MRMNFDTPSARYRTIFISDIHLGTKGCQAELLLDFIKSIECDRLFLVGDIVDGWKMTKSGFYWPQSHNDVVQKLLRLVKGQKGRRQCIVGIETLADGLGPIIGPVLELCTRGGRIIDEMVYLSTAFVGPPMDQPLLNERPWHVELNDGIDLAFSVLKETIERFRLGYRPREPVEHEPPAAVRVHDPAID